MARPRSDIRERLVEAARSRFLADGVDGASLRDIARDAGTSVGIVAYWFPKKSDLFDEVVESAYGPIVADVARLLDEHVSTRERLHAVVLRIAKASSEEIDGLRLIAREAIGSASSSIPLPVILAAFIALAAVPQVVRRAAGPARLAFPGRERLAAISIDLFFRAVGPRAG